MESIPSFNPETSPLREAYSLLGATTPLELSQKYTEAENPSFIDKTWDYNDPEQIQNKVKNILENTDESRLTEEEIEWREEILWFWYHHAMSCANWKQDAEKRKEFADMAMKYEKPYNILTRLMYFLAHGKVKEAEEWIESKSGDADQETGTEFIESYKKNGEWW